jgi:hypothetical protein
VVERALLSRVLQETQGHQGQASKRLGLHRSTLRYRLRELGLSAERTNGDDAIPKGPPSRSGSVPPQLNGYR